MKFVTFKEFQKYGTIFENIKTNEVLKEKLEEYGYDSAEINKGKALYEAALQKVDDNKIKTANEKLSYEKFNQKMNQLKKTYTDDRQKVKIIYKEDSTILSILGVKGLANIRISDILNDADTLYKQLKASDSIRKPLERLKIDEEYINSQISLLEEVKKHYNAYTKDKGESQQATKDKNDAFATLEKWVREFYAIAKIALKDTPQLLESIGKSVKS